MSKTDDAKPMKKGGLDALKKNAMMAHLIDSLDDGKDIGHYGRLTFAMIARHFMDDKDLVKLLAQDKDENATEAAALVEQVKSAGYNPPGRAKIQEWQSKQDFPILPSDDPDAGSVYRDLDFPEGVYDDISHYHEEKAESQGMVPSK